MEEPLQIVKIINDYFKDKNELSHISYTSLKETCFSYCGPTIEVIDPVRFVSNRSSGKWDMQLQKL